MSNPCSPDTSEPKPGAPASLVIDQQYIQNLLPAGLAWLYPYLPWMHGLEVGDVAAFCAADPPTWSMPTAVEFYSFISSGNFGEALLVNKFLQQVTQYYLWYQICKCHTGVSFGSPSVPSAPSGLPSVNPPAVVSLPPNSGTGCKSLIGGGSAIPAGTNLFGYDSAIPAAATYATVTLVSTPHGSVHPTVGVDLVWIGAPSPATTPELRRTNYVLASGGSVPVTETVPQGARAIAFYVTNPGADSLDVFTESGDVFCNAPVDTPSAAPCPPDPAVRQMLKQIYDLLTLVQRQAVPFAYVYGANHAGLTGGGEISVQGLIGVSVDITTLPGRIGRDDGDPQELFDVGYVTLGTADGWHTSRRIDHDGALLIPPSAGVITLVAYSLAPGVVVAIRELVREP